MTDSSLFLYRENHRPISQYSYLQRHFLPGLKRLSIDAILHGLNSRQSISEQLKEIQSLKNIKWVVIDEFDMHAHDIESIQCTWPEAKIIARINTKPGLLLYKEEIAPKIDEYESHGVLITASCKVVMNDLSEVSSKIQYMPNYFNVNVGKNRFSDRMVGAVKFFRTNFPYSGTYRGKELKIGSFGSIRSLNNQLMQAIAAMRIADAFGVPLKFYVSTGIVDDYSNTILADLRELFFHHRNEQHELVECNFLEFSEYQTVLKGMDLVLNLPIVNAQNSTYAVDSINYGVPVISSVGTEWMDEEFQVDPTNTGRIVEVCSHILDNNHNGLISREQLLDLGKYSTEVALSYMGRVFAR